MKIESNWRLIFDPGPYRRVLLEFGDMLDSELEWSLKKPLQVTQLDEARAPFLRHGGNAVVNLSFKIYRARSIDAQSRNEALDQLMDAQSYIKARLQIEVRGMSPQRWVFDQAYVTETGSMCDPDETGVIRSFSITATNLNFYES